MPIVYFSGRVFPAIGLTINPHYQVRWVDKPTDLEITANIEIVNSEVSITCEMNRYADSDFVLLHVQVFQLARTFVDGVAFLTGTGLTLIIDSFTKPDGKRITIEPGDSTLESLCSVTLADICAVAVPQPEIARALNILASTIDRPFVIPVNCALAVEAIANLLAPWETNKEKRWEYLQQHLNLTPDYLKFITHLSRKPRHGHMSLPATPDIVESRKRAWIVMNRYFEFRKRNGSHLPVNEFPVL